MSRKIDKPRVRRTAWASLIDLAIGGCFAAMLLTPSVAAAQLAGKKGPCHRVNNCPASCLSVNSRGNPNAVCKPPAGAKYGTTCGNCDPHKCGAGQACGGGWNAADLETCNCQGTTNGVTYGPKTC